MSKETAADTGLLESESTTNRYYGWLALVAVGLVIGLFGVVRLLTEGTVVLGITDQVPWGVLISTYEFFLLMSAGIMIGVVALSLVFGIERFELVLKRSVLLSLATLAAGLFTILISLGQPLRPIVHALLNANPSSPMWWVIVFAGLFGVVLVALLAVLEFENLGSPRVAAALGTVGLLVGLGVAVAAGLIFGTAEARSYYGGPMAPVYFVLTGLLSGVAAVGFVVIGEYRATATEMSDDLRTLLTGYLGPLLGVLAAAVLLVALAKAAYGLTATSDATALAYEHMLLGSFGPVYWILGILVGLLVPVALMAYPGTRTPTGVLAASGAALVGLFVTRFEFVVGGQVAALVPDGANQYPIAGYTPSLTELAVVVFAFALCALVYTVGRRLFDVEDVPSMPRVTPTPSPAETGGEDDD